MTIGFHAMHADGLAFSLLLRNIYHQLRTRTLGMIDHFVILYKVYVLPMENQLTQL